MVWLVGAGNMAIEYAKVLRALDKKFIVIGRGKCSANAFKDTVGVPVIVGGVDSFIQTNPEKPSFAIVASSIEQLYCTTSQLLDFGVKSILVEKPGALRLKELKELKVKADSMDARVFIAYNRRFYASTQMVQKQIETEGGVKSFNFELTEWAHIIGTLQKPRQVLSKWFLANTSHVTDLAFFLAGSPKEISTYTAGSVDWHSTASVFSGAGISKTGALFSYNGNWQSAGRWVVEILTSENRYIFKPIEQLLIQKSGSIQQKEVVLDDSLDKIFKPGLYKQVEAFFESKSKNLCSLDEQLVLFPVYEKMANYSV